MRTVLEEAALKSRELSLHEVQGKIATAVSELNSLKQMIATGLGLSIAPEPWPHSKYGMQDDGDTVHHSPGLTLQSRKPKHSLLRAGDNSPPCIMEGQGLVTSDTNINPTDIIESTVGLSTAINEIRDVIMSAEAGAHINTVSEQCITQ